MRLKKFTALLLGTALTASMLVGCGSNNGGNTAVDNGGNDAVVETPADDKADVAEVTDEPAAEKEYSEDEIVDWKFFATMVGSEINDGNEIQEMIAKKTGVRVKETWLTGQTAEEAIGTIIASGEYPEFMDGGDGSVQLYENDALVAWDDYLEKYPNLKEMYTDKEWDLFRMDDGKIYWANVFNNTYGESKATGHNDEAFWMQCRVLEWAGYPKIETLDDYFDVLEKFAAENPDFHGVATIPYTALCYDWYYFCIENAPEFLDGYPNDGSVIVNVDDPSKPYIVDYNTTPTAKMYFQKLNEEYQKGMIDKEFATQNHDEYIAKLSTGAVLGMCDQWWDFAFDINDAFVNQGLDKEGCNYVPFGLTAEAGMENQWHSYGDTLNAASGICVTTACPDPDRAFQFLSDLLEQDIHDLRFWGVEGEDYLVDDDGMYYRTEEMRTKQSDPSYQANHLCKYGYFPQWGGTSRDGKNAMRPEEQTSEFFSSLAEPLVKTFEAYGAENYPDMVGSKVCEQYFWYPMYSYSNNMNTETPGGVAWNKMGEVKHKWLPKVVVAGDFESEWNNYMAAYNECKPEDFLAEMQTELDRRAAMAAE